MTDPVADNAIHASAFGWLTRSDRGLSVGERAELRAWLADDPRHFGAYARAKATFAHACRAKSLGPQFDPDAFAQPVALPVQVPRADNDEDRPPSWSRRALLGGMSAMAALGGAIFFTQTSQPAQAVTYRTARGETRSLSLDDGSSVTLNTESEIHVHFNDIARSVALVRGEVLFDIGYDNVGKHERPFIVDAQGFQARAERTSFLIRQISGSQPQLLVKDGLVDIIPAKSAAARIPPHTKVTLGPDGTLVPSYMNPVELEQSLLWRQGKIAFEDTSLSAAIATFSRYDRTVVSVDSPDLLDLKVTGVFSSRDAAGFAHAVAQAFDLRAVSDGRGIRLRKGT